MLHKTLWEYNPTNFSQEKLAEPTLKAFLPVGIVGGFDVLGRNDVERQNSISCTVVHLSLAPNATCRETG